MPRSMTTLSLTFAALAVTPIVSAAPEPSPIPTRWELTIEPGPLRIAAVDVPGVGTRDFFYLTYKVTNNSGEDLYFAPSFELATDDGLILRAGQGVTFEVTNAILGRLNNPFLKDQISIIGVLPQGEENAQEGLIVWPAENLLVDEVTVYATGFSGETRRIPRPDSPPDGPPQEVVLRKTLMLVHSTPGEITGKGNEPLPRITTRWILR